MRCCFSLPVLTATAAAVVVTLSPSFATAQEEKVVDLIASNDSLGFLSDALTNAGVDELGDGAYTVFAPNDAAFLALSQAYPELNKQINNPTGIWEAHFEDILRYHIVRGTQLSTDLMAQGYIMLNDRMVDIDPASLSITDEAGEVSTIISSDLTATNGVVHIVDSVFVPDWLKTSIIDLAIGLPENFSIFVGLLNRVNFADPLSEMGEDSTGYTVFAPINSAFDGIDTSTLTDDEVKSILLYHVVLGPVRVTSGPVVTLNGATLMVDVNESGFFYINDALVATPNILAKNGLIHIVTKVLMPPNNGDAGTPTTIGSNNDNTPTMTPPGSAPSSSSAATTSTTTTTVSMIATLSFVLGGAVAFVL